MSAFERVFMWVGFVVGGVAVLYAVIALVAAAWLGCAFSKGWKR